MADLKMRQLWRDPAFLGLIQKKKAAEASLNGNQAHAPILRTNSTGGASPGGGGEHAPGSRGETAGGEGQPTSGSSGADNPAGSPTSPTPENARSKKPNLGPPSEEVLRERVAGIPNAEVEVQDLRARLRDHPDTVGVEDMLEQAEQKGWKPGHEDETKNERKKANRRPASQRELAKRVEKSRNIPPLDQGLKNLPEWDELARQLRDAEDRLKRLKDAQKELTRRANKKTEARERVGLYAKPHAEQGATTTAPRVDPKAAPTSSATPASPPKTSSSTPTALDSGKKPTPSLVPNVPDKLQQDAADFARRVEGWHQASKDFQTKQGQGGKSGEQFKTRLKQAEAFKLEGDNLTKQLAAVPELAGTTGANAKETLNKARNKAHKGGNLANIAGILLDAYELVEDISYILKADSALEGLGRTLEVGGNYAVGAAEYALFQAVTRSNPVSFALSIIASMPSDQGQRGRYAEDAARKIEEEEQAKEITRRDRLALGRYLEKHAPGSVEIVENVVYIRDQRVWDEAAKFVEELQKENFAKQKAEKLRPARELGIQDGLIGIRVNRGKVSFSEDDTGGQTRQKHDDQDAYEAGWKEGQARKDAALKRARDTGFNDGKDGKASNFDALKGWPEMQALARADLVRRGTNDQLAEAQGLFNQYSDAYAEGFRAGQAQVAALVLDRLEISPTDFAVGAYSMRRLRAHAVYTDGSKREVSTEVSWLSSKLAIVNVRLDDGVIYADMLSVGKADITVLYASKQGTRTKKITITVNPPNISIVSAKATYLVGDKVPFRLHNRDEAMPSLEGLDATAFAWNSSPREIVSIDQNGLAVMLKEGKAVITAADKKSPAVARTEVTVKARP